MAYYNPIKQGSISSPLYSNQPGFGSLFFGVSDFTSLHGLLPKFRKRRISGGGLEG